MPDEHFSLRLSDAPKDDKGRWAAARAIATKLGVPMAQAQTMLDRLPVSYPARFASAEEARAELSGLTELGVVGTVVSATGGRPCHDHPHLPADGVCERCDAPLCGLCATLDDGEARCEACRHRAQRSRGFFLLRVSVLLTILVALLLYAYNDVRKRHVRTDWRRTLIVSLVVVPKAPLDEEALTALERRVVALEGHLADEMARYRPGPPPFDLETTRMPFGPIATPPRPPSEPDDWWGALTFNVELARWVDEVDERAGLTGRSFDASIYLVADDGDGRTMLSVEGIGQQGGRIGVIEVDLTEQMVDTALFVVTHELFHILGASDKYDPTGQPIEPNGLADPQREPLYPQARAEVMARHRATSATESVLPERLEELAVGTPTAEEIRWLEP